jgi:hypothetical protein
METKGLLCNLIRGKRADNLDAIGQLREGQGRL